MIVIQPKTFNIYRVQEGPSPFMLSYLRKKNVSLLIFCRKLGAVNIEDSTE